VCIVYTSTHVTQKVQHRIIKLRYLVENVLDGEETVLHRDRDSYQDVHLFGSTLRKESPFTDIFEIYMPTDMTDGMQGEENILNAYYLKNVFMIFHKRYMHLLPLFSGILLQPERYGRDRTVPLATISVTRLTNSLVEGWFRTVKVDILQKKKILL